MAPDNEYQPMMSAERARRLRRWHLEADKELRRGLPRRMLYLGLDLLVPETVFAPSTNGLFHPLVRAEAKPSDRVLDMGTGSGISAILAAATSSDVVAVDVNPRAVEAARANAARNGVADRITFRQSDVFNAVDGSFDLIIFHPPYRWFKARDLLEISHTDQNYGALRRFMGEVPERLRPRGRVLINFGTSGDIDYLYHLIDQAGLKNEVLASDEVVSEHLTVTYYVFRLTE
ncbi:MAG TPA: methyltransferase [Candidatus Dormibacteraeota bacterium]|nr:methyltransferase [Candidatus Dormibacteraeota bacterium]